VTKRGVPAVSPFIGLHNWHGFPGSTQAMGYGSCFQLGEPHPPARVVEHKTAWAFLAQPDLRVVRRTVTDWSSGGRGLYTHPLRGIFSTEWLNFELLTFRCTNRVVLKRTYEPLPLSESCQWLVDNKHLSNVYGRLTS